MADRVIVVDRDGVINEDSDDYIKSSDEWKAIPGSIEALSKLSHAGCRICVVSNQSGLGRGLFGLSELNDMHRKLRDLLAGQGAQIEMIAFCPHLPADGCGCRKPRPGLLLAVQERLGVALKGVPYIGDSLSDVQAARAAGMEPWLVRTGKGERTLAREGRSLGNTRVFSNLLGAAEYFLYPGPSL
jgi:D-glycero-D-manno-heptose 1,7-bisphosphate phosphatase